MNVDALNKPMKTNAVRFTWLGLANLFLSGGFFATILVTSRNFSGYYVDTVLYLTIAVYFVTQFMLSYISIIWSLQVGRIFRQYI